MITVRCSCGVCQEWALIELQANARAARGPVCASLTRAVPPQGEIERNDGEAVLDGLDVGMLCQTAEVLRQTTRLSVPRFRALLAQAAAAGRSGLLTRGRRATQGVLSLTVGYHEVEGKLSTLKKPLAILSRVAGDTGGELSYEVVGVIRRKYHFKTRPKALISKPDPGKRQKTEQGAAMRAFFSKQTAP